MLDTTLAQAALAASVTALLLGVTVPLAHRMGWVDRPGGRKHHLAPTPTTGGLAIVGGLMVAAMVATSSSPAFLSLLAACALLVVVGMADDARDIRWYWRILAQVCAALILVYGGGVKVEYVGQIFSSEPLWLGEWAVPFTVIGTVGVINAINMSDGADGLAGLLCAVALTMLAAAAAYAGNTELLSVLVPILATVAVFLMFNMRSPWLSHAKAFLGNAGSAVLGLVIAWAAFRLTQNVAHPVSPALAPWLLAPPLIDCLVLAARRLKLGRSPFVADRDHVHHLMLEAGFTHTRVAFLLALLSCVLGLSAALVLRTDIGNETHLVLGFALMTLAYYLMTSRRIRAVRIFTKLERVLGARRQPAPAEPGADTIRAGAALAGSGIDAAVSGPVTPAPGSDPQRERSAVPSARHPDTRACGDAEEESRIVRLARQGRTLPTASNDQDDRKRGLG